MSKETIENIIEKKVVDILAARALDQPSIAPQPDISEEVQKRLDILEQKIDGKDDGREQGLALLLMARQHAVRGEDASALKMYTLAKTYFPDNKKLDMKIEKLQDKTRQKKENMRLIESDTLPQKIEVPVLLAPVPRAKAHRSAGADEDYHEEEAAEQDYESDRGFRYKAKGRKGRPRINQTFSAADIGEEWQTPRTKQLLEIVNRRDITQIRLLKGVGVKKAEAIWEALCMGEEGEEKARSIRSLEQLERLRGLSTKTVEAMRSGFQSDVHLR